MLSDLVDEDYLSILGVKLLQTRQYSLTEAREQRPVIIINKRIASKLSAADNPDKSLQLHWANDSCEILC